MLKSVSRRPARVGEVLLERDGSVIPDQARMLCRWEEHFKELLNHAAPPNTACSPLDTPAAENDPCEVSPPTLDEVCTTIRQLRNNRAADGIPPKLLRLIKAYYSSTKMKVRASGNDSMPFEIRYKDVFSPLPSSIT